MSNPKVVLFIVEGETDKKTLYLPISEIYSEYDDSLIVEFCSPYFKDTETYGGDITTFRDTTPLNIKKQIINTCIIPFLESNRIYKLDDILEIIHIVDTDGTFIPQEKVVLDSSLPENTILYDEKNLVIKTRNPQGIINRNIKKSRVLRQLINTNKIIATYEGEKIEINYRIYFFSCNLEHYFHGDANVKTSREKQILALKKCLEFTSNIEAFLKRTCKYFRSMNGLTWEESWSTIATDCNSLKAYSNIGILINELINYDL